MKKPCKLIQGFSIISSFLGLLYHKQVSLFLLECLKVIRNTRLTLILPSILN